MPLGDKAKAALPLRAATLKQQAMITRQSGERQASLKPALGSSLYQPLLGLPFNIAMPFIWTMSFILWISELL